MTESPVSAGRRQLAPGLETVDPVLDPVEELLVVLVDVGQAFDDEPELEAGDGPHDDLERELVLVESVVPQSLSEMLLEDRAQPGMHLGEPGPQRRHVPAHGQQLEEDHRKPRRRLVHPELGTQPPLLGKGQCGIGVEGFEGLGQLEAYPESTVTGFDAHDGSVEAARKRAADAGLADRVEFGVATAATFGGTYDLVCFFDCLHDMGDPAGACTHVRERLEPDGTLMLVEPFAGNDLGDNLNPVGAAYYGFSTLLCTPSSLSQDVGTALGAQAGEARLRDIVTSAGFNSFRRVAETPFNMVLEAKP
jgi:SAM-dependent methyltransferase